MFRLAVIKLATERPELRKHLVPLLREATDFPTQEALDTYLKAHPNAHRELHHVKPSEPHGFIDKTLNLLKTKKMKERQVEQEAEEADKWQDRVDYKTKQWKDLQKFRQENPEKAKQMDEFDKKYREISTRGITHDRSDDSNYAMPGYHTDPSSPWFTASLRSGIIGLAASNPELRKHLVPLLRKHAALLTELVRIRFPAGQELHGGVAGPFRPYKVQTSKGSFWLDVQKRRDLDEAVFDQKKVKVRYSPDDQTAEWIEE